MRTFVLIHRAYHGRWCWTRVAKLLRDAGRDVHTPTLAGMGEHAHLLSRQHAEIRAGHDPMISTPGELTRLLRG